MVRSMLNDAKMNGAFWVEVVITAVYLLNRAPTKAREGMTLEEAWIGVKPSISHLRVFGCTDYIHIFQEQRKKLERLITFKASSLSKMCKR